MNLFLIYGTINCLLIWYLWARFVYKDLPKDDDMAALLAIVPGWLFAMAFFGLWIYIGEMI